MALMHVYTSYISRGPIFKTKCICTAAVSLHISPTGSSAVDFSRTLVVLTAKGPERPRKLKTFENIEKRWKHWQKLKQLETVGKLEKKASFFVLLCVSALFVFRFSAVSNRFNIFQLFQFVQLFLFLSRFLKSQGRPWTGTHPQHQDGCRGSISRWVGSCTPSRLWHLLDCDTTLTVTPH